MQRMRWGSCCACCTRSRRTSHTRCGASSAISAEHGEIIDASWPQVDEAALAQDEMELVVQVNGKVRGSIRVPAHADDAAITATALADANVIRFVEGRADQVFEGGASEACDDRGLAIDASRAVDHAVAVDRC